MKLLGCLAAAVLVAVAVLIRLARRLSSAYPEGNREFEDMELALW